MKWNWQQPDWPHFHYDESKLSSFVGDFLYQAGTLSGSLKLFPDRETKTFFVELMSDEACSTSEIEGKLLNRKSVLSSLKRKFGLKPEYDHATAAEQGIANLMVDLYQNYDKKLCDKTLFRWHRYLLQHDTKLCDVGKYRTHLDPMQVVSGQIDRPKIHFEAPPSKYIPKEMDGFVKWYNQSHGSKDLSPIIRAGLTHLYFVSLHPFEDGNGRIARALSLKVLLEFLQWPQIILLSQTIQKKRNDYYKYLERNNKTLEVTEWLDYFCRVVIMAQTETQKKVEFIIQKTKFFDEHDSHLNKRQKKVILRMFREGPEGFKGGLSVKKYLSIMKTSRATATRDLQNLVKKGAFKQTGQLKGTRYHLVLKG